MLAARKRQSDFSQFCKTVALTLLGCGLLANALNCQFMPATAANSQATPGATSTQNYGTISDTIVKIEETLEKSQKNLSPGDLHYFREALAGLKRSAEHELDRGADASTMTAPALSLQSELNQRLRDNANSYALVRKQLEATVLRLEEIFNTRSVELIKDDKERYERKLADLKARQQLSPDEDHVRNQIVRECHELESEIVHSSMFRSRKNQMKDEMDLIERPISGRDGGEKRDLEKTAAVDEVGSAAPYKGQLTEYGVSPGPVKPLIAPATPVPVSPPLPRKPMVSVVKLMGQIEHELLELHEWGRIGTFDIDAFTARLLSIKRNWQVMTQKSGQLSFRQENTLRHELMKLNQNISDRVNGVE